MLQRLKVLWQRDDDEADVLESAIDLFSLLSFVLVAAAMSFASTGAPTSAHSAVLSFGTVTRTDATTAIPRGATVLVVAGANPVLLLERRSNEGTRTVWSSDGRQSIEQALDATLGDLSKAEYVGINLQGSEDDDALPRFRALYRLQAWLGSKQIDATVFLDAPE